MGGQKELMRVSGGLFTNGSHMPDWVDSTVAGWIQSETEMMDTAWGPPEQRSALAFVHIPPWVSSCDQGSTFVDRNRHVIQTVQENLNSSINPGLNGRSPSAFCFDTWKA